MATDDATGLPINICNTCDKEVVGFVDNPKEDFYCEDCKKLCIMCGKKLDDSDYENSCKGCE